MTRFLRTASPRNLIAAVLGAVLIAAAGGAIAVAATSGGPVPPRRSLPRAIHAALAAPAIRGLSARISFTDGLIPSSDFQGSDPLLGGGTGRLWVSPAAHRLRIEVQGENGDAQVVVNGRSFWVYDPSSNTVFRGSLPASGHAAEPPKSDARIPTVAAISQRLATLSSHLSISGARPTDVAGEPAYAVRVSPRQHGGLLGSLAVAWDALRGVPLHFAVYAKGVSAPVLALTVTHVSFGALPASDFGAAAPQNAKVVNVDTGAQTGGSHAPPAKGAPVTGLGPVASKLPFTLSAPDALAGYARGDVRLLGAGGPHPAALVGYGQGLDGVIILEQAAAAHTPPPTSSGGDHQGLTIPTVTIGGISAQELQTPLGTVLRFTRSGVAFTVLGSEPAKVVEAAARGL